MCSRKASADEGGAAGGAGVRCHYCRRPGLSPRSIRSRLLFKRRVLRRLDAFEPDLIFLSAGFDGHIKDPIGGEVVGWTEDDFYWLTMQVQKVAQRRCNGRCVSVLEGGYNVRGGSISPLALCVREHVRALVKASHMQLESDTRATVAAAAANPSDALSAAAAGGDTPMGGGGPLAAGPGDSPPSGVSTGSGGGCWEEDEFSDDGSDDADFSSSDDEIEDLADFLQEAAEEEETPFCVDDAATSAGPVLPPTVPLVVSSAAAAASGVQTPGAAAAVGTMCGGEPLVEGAMDVKEPFSGNSPPSATSGEWVGSEESRVFQAIQEGVRSPSAISSVSDDSARAAGSAADAAAATQRGARGEAGSLPSSHQQPLAVVATSTSASDAETSPRRGLCELSAPDAHEHYSKALLLRHLCGFHA